MPTDYEFLLELIRQIDANPSHDITAQDVATAIGHPDPDQALEDTVRRLKNRALIDWAPGPQRGTGWTSSPLAVTPDGYRHDGTGLGL